MVYGYYFSDFTKKIYVVGTHYKCLDKALVMSTYSIVMEKKKKNISAFQVKMHLICRYVQVHRLVQLI